MPPEFDPDSLKRNYGVNFVIWWLLASAYSGRNLLILTIGDDMPPWVWSRFFKKKRWSQLQLHFRLLLVRSCPKSILGFRCFQERVCYLQRWCFHVGFLEFQNHSKHKNHFDCPVGSCHTGVLGFECLQEMDGYLQKLFSCKTFGISKSFQAKKPFWCLFNKLVLERIQVISLLGFMLTLTRMRNDIRKSCMSGKFQSGCVKHL